MKHIYIANSKIAGKGIFAGEDINKGEVIRCIKGELKFKINKNKRDALANPNWIGVSENIWIDPAKPYKFLNHSCNPNTGIKGKVSLIALKDISEGDEIVIDYSIIEADDRWEMPCSCGFKKCRKLIRSISYLPMNIYNKYTPHISKFFQRKYLTKIKSNIHDAC